MYLLLSFSLCHDRWALTHSRARLLGQSVDSQVGNPRQQDVHETNLTTARRVQTNHFTWLEFMETILKTC